MRLKAVFPLHVHVAHVVFHAAVFAYMCSGFVTSLRFAENDGDSTEPMPGSRLRFFTTWVPS